MQTQSIQITSKDKIFATGVHLQAVQIEINGIKQWRWVAVDLKKIHFLMVNVLRFMIMLILLRN
jgi:hypothetical protein